MYIYIKNTLLIMVLYIYIHIYCVRDIVTYKKINELPIYIYRYIYFVEAIE